MSISPPESLNDLPEPELIERLRSCLDVRRWAEEIAARRPYGSVEDVFEAAEEAGRHLDTEEIHTALAAHPRIGERSDSAWSRGEQSGVDAEDAGLVAALREANEEYERRFGHVYLVCASGRGGPELLEILRARLNNDQETELGIVAEELRKIARLRLAKVVR